MAYIRDEVLKAVSENDIGVVVFQDPLSDESRKAKRNLVASSFAAILIAALQLQVNGFLGLQTVGGPSIGASLTKGLACLVVMYFLAAFLIAFFVDYSGWKFKRERYLIAPYSDLVRMTEQNFHGLTVQISNATRSLATFSADGMHDEMGTKRAIADAQGQLTSIAKYAHDLDGEIRPLLAHWHDTVQKTQRLSWRLRLRFLGLWALDILVPFTLAALAVWRTFDGVPAVVLRVAG